MADFQSNAYRPNYYCFCNTQGQQLNDQANHNGPKERDIFMEALGMQSREEREAYLKGACGDNPLLRRAVDELLENHFDKNGFMEQAAAPEAETIIIKKPSEDEAPGSIIGRYKILQKIGEGGFGIVYMAEQQDPVVRKVALKIIKLGMDTKQVIARFEAERQALALMDHPNIARVLDAGATESGRPYFVMELVRGIPLLQYCDNNNLSYKERLQLFISICQAIQHAHQKGIIHRDIKPSNVMVTMHDDKPAPKVIDFGIAKATQQRLTQKTLFTEFQQFIGTPVYMSPEQTQMSGLDVDTRSDIYSLGALLYEILVGRPPFDPDELMSSGIEHIRQKIREEDPLKPSSRLTTLSVDEQTRVAKTRHSDPSRLRALIRGELDWIVMKAMEKDRTRRYESSSALAQDIERHLNNEPVTAVAPNPAYLLLKFYKRRRSEIITVIAFVLLLIASTIVSSFLAIQARKAENNANNSFAQEYAAKIEAQDARDQQRRIAYGANMNLAFQYFNKYRYGEAARLLETMLPLAGQRDLRGWEWRYLWDQCKTDELCSLKGHLGYIYSISFSPDGKLLASGGGGKKVMIWDTNRMQPVTNLFHDISRQYSHLSPLLFSPDGKWFVACVDYRVKICNAKTWEEAHTLNDSVDLYRSIAFSPDSKMLAVANRTFKPDDHRVHIYDTSSWQIIHRLPGCYQTNNPKASFLSDSKTLVYKYSSDIVHFYDIRNKRILKTYQMQEPTKGARRFSVSPDGNTLITYSLDTPAIVLETDKFHEITRITGHIRGIRHCKFSLDGKYVVTVGNEPTIKVWETSSWDKVSTLRGLNFPAASIDISPDSMQIASGCYDGDVKLWNSFTKLRENSVLTYPDDMLKGNARIVDYSNHGDYFIICRSNMEFSVYAKASLEEIFHGKLATESADKVAISPDGSIIATAKDRSISLYAIPSLREKLHIQNTDSATHLLRFSPDGRLLAIFGGMFGKGSYIQIWDIENEKRIASFEYGKYNTLSMVFSSDCKRLATTHFGAVCVWDIPSNEKACTFEYPEIMVDVAFSPCGEFLACVGSQMHLWDIENQKVIERFRGAFMMTRSTTFSPDGNRIACGTADGYIKIWDLKTFQTLAQFKAYSDTVCWLQFLPDGERLLSVGNEGVTVFHAPSFDEIASSASAESL
jgi:eukaryotic-like serine/threonine-protein kinase